MSTNNANILNEIFCSTSRVELTEAHRIYNTSNNTKLKDRLQARLSTNHGSLLVQILLNGRNENQDIDAELAKQQADEFKAILDLRGILGLTDEAIARLITLVLSLSYSQCIIVKVCFKHLIPSLALRLCFAFFPGRILTTLSNRPLLGGSNRNLCRWGSQRRSLRPSIQSSGYSRLPSQRSLHWAGV
jgi:hypothetical protein